MQRLFGSRALAIVAVSLLAMIGGALLAWWQWTRYQSASGTMQNLGYVLQWPLFGVFPAFMFWRIHRTAQRERERDTDAESNPDQAAEPIRGAAPTSFGRTVTTDTAPADDGPWAYTQNRTMTYSVDEDAELLAYNQYLADLSAHSADREHRHAG